MTAAERADLLTRLRKVIGWVSERDHSVAVELDDVVYALETRALNVPTMSAPVSRSDADRPVPGALVWERRVDCGTPHAYMVEQVDSQGGVKLSHWTDVDNIVVSQEKEQES